jgi:hypothetical protein
VAGPSSRNGKQKRISPPSGRRAGRFGTIAKSLVFGIYKSRANYSMRVSIFISSKSTTHIGAALVVSLTRCAGNRLRNLGPIPRCPDWTAKRTRRAQDMFAGRARTSVPRTSRGLFAILATFRTYSEINLATWSQVRPSSNPVSSSRESVSCTEPQRRRRSSTVLRRSARAWDKRRDGLAEN